MADPSLPRTIPCRARDETPGEHALRLLLSLLAIAGLIWLASAGRFSVQQVRSLLANPVIWILMVTWCVPLLRTERNNHYDWCCCHCRHRNVYRASRFSLPMFILCWRCFSLYRLRGSPRTGQLWLQPLSPRR